MLRVIYTHFDSMHYLGNFLWQSVAFYVILEYQSGGDWK